MIPVADYWNTLVADFILEQFKSATNWQYILKACIDQYEFLEKEVWKLASVLDFKCRVKNERPSGELLDFISGIVGVERKYGESDTDLYNRMVLRIQVHDEGTADYVLYNCVKESGDPEPIYIEESPATFLVYTPNGRQIRRSVVNKFSAVGVLGLPAAALKTASGKFIVDGSRLEWNLTDDDGETLTSDDGDTLTWLEKPARKMLCVARDENIGNTVQKTVLTEDGNKVLTEDGLVLRTDV